MKFYCQNIHQSGDTTGVAMALVLHPEQGILFMMNHDELVPAASYVQFYSDLGVSRARLSLLITDADSEKRSAPTAPMTGTQTEDLERRLARIDRDYGDVETSRLREKKAFVKQHLESRLAPMLHNRAQTIEKRGQGELLAKYELKHAGNPLNFAAQINSPAVPDKEKVHARLVLYSGNIKVWDPLEALQSRDMQATLSTMGISPSKLLNELRAGNQLYQDLVNLGIRTRGLEHLKRFYQSFFGLAMQGVGAASDVRTPAKHSYLEVGQTTRDVKSHLETHKLATTVRKLHEPFVTRPIPEVKTFTSSFVNTVLTHTKSKPIARGRGKVPMFVLIWVRGLSPGEMKSYLQSNIASTAISDDKLESLNAYKRNPHHVMTAQLYGTIEHLLGEFNRKSKDRFFIPIPIGDEIRYDQYNTASPLFVKSEACNLVQFFTRLEKFKGNRYAQMCLIYELMTRPEIGLMQIGIRSGAMEQGMYLGAPTIYIEEEFAESGGRMSRLTRWGSEASQIDALFLEALEEAGKASEPEKLRRNLSTLREVLHRGEYTSSPGMGDKLFLEMDYGAVQPKVTAILNHWRTAKSRASSYATATEYPFFYRLVTQNLVGLNQARTKQGYDQFMSALTQDKEVPERLLKGSLRDVELELLRSYIQQISASFEDYREALIPKLKGRQLAPF